MRWPLNVSCAWYPACRHPLDPLGDHLQALQLHLKTSLCWPARRYTPAGPSWIQWIHHPFDEISKLWKTEGEAKINEHRLADQQFFQVQIFEELKISNLVNSSFSPKLSVSRSPTLPLSLAQNISLEESITCCYTQPIRPIQLICTTIQTMNPNSNSFSFCFISAFFVDSFLLIFSLSFSLSLYIDSIP